MEEREGKMPESSKVKRVPLRSRLALARACAICWGGKGSAEPE